MIEILRLAWETQTKPAQLKELPDDAPVPSQPQVVLQIPDGMCRDLMRIIANVAYRNRENQDEV